MFEPVRFEYCIEFVSAYQEIGVANIPKRPNRDFWKVDSVWPTEAYGEPETTKNASSLHIVSQGETLSLDRRRALPTWSGQASI